MPTTCIYLLQESAKRRTHKQQKKDNESDLLIDKFRNLNHDIETFKILWQSLRCFTHESRGGRGAVWAVPDYCTKKDFWTTLGILNWHILIYFCACVFHRFQISPSQLQSRLGVTRTSGQYFATIVRRNFPFSAIPRSPSQRYSNCQIALGIILQDLNRISFFRTTLKFAQDSSKFLHELAKVVTWICQSPIGKVSKKNF